MRCVKAALFVLALLPLSAAAGKCAWELPPGEVTSAQYPGYHGKLEIYRPEGAAEETGYPVILWYHGYSDRLRPNVRIPRAITGGKIFLLVGMDYGSARFYEDLERIALDEEVDRFHAVLDELSRCVDIDRSRIIMAGYSQGGYATTLIGEHVMDELAGLVILGAGRSKGGRDLPAEADMAGKRVFVGFGEGDTVHGEVALVTAKVYALLGAEVSMERWPETNHVEGWQWYQEDVARTAGLRNWLNDILATEQ